MGTAITNKIVTRGFGSPRSVVNNSGPVTLGFGPLAPAFVTDSLARRRQLRFGQSGTKRRLQELDEVIVWAKLVSVNHKQLDVDIKGFVRVGANKNSGRTVVMAEHVSTRARSIWETIKVTVKRLGRE